MRWADFPDAAFPVRWVRARLFARRRSQLPPTSSQSPTSSSPRANRCRWLRTLKAQGFEAVIYLAPPTVDDAVRDEHAIVAGQGLAFVNIPIDFARPSEQDFELFAAVMRGPREAQGARALPDQPARVVAHVPLSHDCVARGSGARPTKQSRACGSRTTSGAAISSRNCAVTASPSSRTSGVAKSLPITDAMRVLRCRCHFAAIDLPALASRRKLVHGDSCENGWAPAAGPRAPDA